MKVVGLDLSLLGTGLCVIGGEVDYPSVSTRLLKRGKASGVEESIRRLHSIAEEAIGVVKDEKPDAVVIEAPAMNQKWQAAAIGEIHGVIKYRLLYDCGIVPLVEQATKLRTFVVGKIEKTFVKETNDKGNIVKKVSYGTVIGKSGKPRKATIKDIIEQRLREIGLQFPSQDEMDAYVAAKYGWEKIR